MAILRDTNSRCFAEIKHCVTHKHSRSVRALVIVYRYCESFIDINTKIDRWPKTGYKKVDTAT